MDVSLLLRNKTEKIDLPEYADLGPFTIRSLDGADRSRIIACYADDKSPDKIEAVSVMIALGFGDKDGNRIFDDSQIESAKRLPCRVIDALATAIRRFNYMTQEAVDAAKKD
jgi:hypothetical protein